MDGQNTLIGCEVFIRKGDTLLLGKRKNVFGSGMWALPGGHLEYGERLVDAICREIKEELGATVLPSQLNLVSLVDDLPMPENNKHYLHVTFELLEPDFEPCVAEPDLCEEWCYFPMDNLPEPIFSPHLPSIENYKLQRLYGI